MEQAEVADLIEPSTADAQTWTPVPDGISSNTTLTTATSSSTVTGIGMISGRMVKRVRIRAIELMEHMRIRLRLSDIRRTIRTIPNRSLPDEEIQDIVEDLNELLHDDYAEEFRRDAVILKHRLTQQLTERTLEVDRERFRHEAKVLLLGTNNSKASTIVKQMKIMHPDGYTDEELVAFRPVVYMNVLESAQAIIKAMRKLGFRPRYSSNQELEEKIRGYSLDDTGSVLSPEIANAIHTLMQDPVVHKIMDEHSSEFHLMDGASYFLTEVLRIGSPRYRPSVTDILHAQPQSKSISETRFSMGPNFSICIFDASGLRSERRKWMPCFESVTSLIFCAALSDYDLVLLEEANRNRLLESLVLFESIVNSRWFLRTSIILLFTQIDVFKHKLPRIPLERYFPEYIGGNDINKATRYILWKFMQANRARLSVYPHLVGLNDSWTLKLVSAAVKETIARNTLISRKSLGQSSLL